VVAAFDFAEKAFGTVNGLVNCAAILAAGPATDIPAEAVEHLLNTNLKGLFLTSREAAKRLIQTEQPGRIVNIASAAAFGYSPKLNTALYTASKAGVIRLTETLALEWARHNINVNAIAPGYFRSEMSAEFVETYGSRVSSRFPRQRMGEPEYLVGTLFYLLSEASHFVTGTCIIADDAQFTR
jgi:NAD(P)-dependent dehydrogenase (short-subunit alcohol dehydrogenase family)